MMYQLHTGTGTVLAAAGGSRSSDTHLSKDSSQALDGLGLSQWNLLAGDGPVVGQPIPADGFHPRQLASIYWAVVAEVKA
jgi:hypothetical protein